EDHRTGHFAERLGHSTHEKDWHQARVEASRANQDGIELADRLGDRWVDPDGRLEPDTLDETARRLSGIDFDFPTSHRAVTVFGADGPLPDADGPPPSPAAEQGTKAIHGVEEVPAIPPHHREKQVPAGVAPKASVFERRQTSQQHPSG